MKTIALALLLGFSGLYSSADEQKSDVAKAVNQALHQAFIKHRQDIAKASLAYREAVAATFKHADRVEIYLLDHAIGADKDPAYQVAPGEDGFDIVPYMTETKILKKQTIAPTEIGKWCAAVTKTITSKKSGPDAACHLPIHGIRIFLGERELFDTSFCWLCDNYHFNHAWVPLSSDSEDLKKLFDATLPIPQKEIDRLPGEKKEPKK